MIVKDDHLLVTVHPKHYVGSSGSVWASENVFLRWEHPQLYEVETTSLHPAYAGHGVGLPFLLY